MSGDLQHILFLTMFIGLASLAVICPVVVAWLLCRENSRPVNPYLE
jgi:hypothetical protein